MGRNRVMFQLFDLTHFWQTLREKCPYSELFWFTFSHIRIECEKFIMRVFSPNEGKYWPEYLRIRTLFTEWNVPISYPLKNIKMRKLVGNELIIWKVPSCILKAIFIYLCSYIFICLSLQNTKSLGHWLPNYWSTSFFLEFHSKRFRAWSK